MFKVPTITAGKVYVSLPMAKEHILKTVREKDWDALGAALTPFKKHLVPEWIEALFSSEDDPAQCLLYQALRCGDVNIFFRVLHFCADPNINMQLPNFLAKKLSRPYVLDNKTLPLMDYAAQQGAQWSQAILEILEKFLGFCETQRMWRKTLLTYELCAIMFKCDPKFQDHLLIFFSKNVYLLESGELCPLILSHIVEKEMQAIPAQKNKLCSFSALPFYSKKLNEVELMKIDKNENTLLVLFAQLATLDYTQDDFIDKLTDILKNNEYAQLPCFSANENKTLFKAMQRYCGISQNALSMQGVN